MTIRNLDVEKIGHYLARVSMFQLVVWDDEKQLWKYKVNHSNKDSEQYRYCIKMLPLAVPGLNIIETEVIKNKYNNEDSVNILFTWDKQAMERRYKELFEEYGAADERRSYMKCSGRVNRKQLSLPGVVYTESQTKVYSDIFVAWTHHGVLLMDSAFTNRIMYPNRGGLQACPHSNWRCEVGDDWWLVGSRGDSADILELEIQASCLEQKYKENLLFNLRSYEKQRRETEEARRDS
jgi:hypothetical protein